MNKENDRWRSTPNLEVGHGVAIQRYPQLRGISCNELRHGFTKNESWYRPSCLWKRLRNILPMNRGQ